MNLIRLDAVKKFLAEAVNLDELLDVSSIDRMTGA